MCENPSRSAICEKLLAPTAMPFFLIPMLSFNFRRWFSSSSTCLNKLGCCNVIGWLAFCFNRLFVILPHQSCWVCVFLCVSMTLLLLSSVICIQVLIFCDYFWFHSGIFDTIWRVCSSLIGSWDILAPFASHWAQVKTSCPSSYVNSSFFSSIFVDVLRNWLKLCQCAQTAIVNERNLDGWSLK